MSLRVEAVTRAAAVPLAMMHGSCFPDDPWDAAALGRILLLSGAFAFGAWAQDEPIAFLIARDLGDEVEILSLGVLPERRRLGVGHALLAAVIAETEMRGIGSVVLEVAINNEAALGLYFAAGFRQVGRRPRYYRNKSGVMDALILRRSTKGERSLL